MLISFSSHQFVVASHHPVVIAINHRSIVIIVVVGHQTIAVVLIKLLHFDTLLFQSSWQHF